MARWPAPATAAAVAAFLVALPALASAGPAVGDAPRPLLAGTGADPLPRGADIAHLRAAGVPSLVPRIVDGSPADEGEYPFYAILEVGDGLCAGTLVGEVHVLTAAHCVDAVEDLADITVYTGTQVLDFDEGQVASSVADIHVHEGWDADGNENDIALLELATSSFGVSSFTPATVLISGYNVPAVALAAGDALTIIGNGATESGGEASVDLLEATVPFVDAATCEEAWGPLAPTMLCAGDGTGDTCQGDSGGFLGVADDAGDWVQVGITSFGASCNDPDFPGVYTDLAAYTDWLTDILGQPGAAGPEDFTCGTADVDGAFDTDPFTLPEGVGDGIEAGFEDGWAGWAPGDVGDDADVVASSMFGSAPSGDGMLALGTPARPFDEQEPGPNVACTYFTATEDPVVFAYEAWTTDGAPGYDHFSYQLKTEAGEVLAEEVLSGADIVSRSFGEYGTTGWREVEVDVSGHAGEGLVLQLSAGGEDDTLYPTWAFVDASALLEPPIVGSGAKTPFLAAPGEMGTFQVGVLDSFHKPGKWKADASGQASASVPLAALTPGPATLTVTGPSGTATAAVGGGARSTGLILEEATGLAPKAGLCVRAVSEGYALAGATLTFTGPSLAKPASARTDAAGRACATVTVGAGVPSVTVQVAMAANPKLRLAASVAEGTFAVTAPFDGFDPEGGRPYELTTLAIKGGAATVGFTLYEPNLEIPLPAGKVAWTAVGTTPAGAAVTTTGTAAVKNGAGTLVLKGYDLGEEVGLTVRLAPNPALLHPDILLGEGVVDLGGFEGIVQYSWASLAGGSYTVSGYAYVEDEAGNWYAPTGGSLRLELYDDGAEPLAEGDPKPVATATLRLAASGFFTGKAKLPAGGGSFTPELVLAAIPTLGVAEAPLEALDLEPFTAPYAVGFDADDAALTSTPSGFTLRAFVVDEPTSTPQPNVACTWRLGTDAEDAPDRKCKTGKDGLLTLTASGLEEGTHAIELAFPAQPKLGVAASTVTGLEAEVGGDVPPAGIVFL